MKSIIILLLVALTLNSKAQECEIGISAQDNKYLSINSTPTTMRDPIYRDQSHWVPGFELWFDSNAISQLKNGLIKAKEWHKLNAIHKKSFEKEICKVTARVPYPVPFALKDYKSGPVVLTLKFYTGIINNEDSYVTLGMEYKSHLIISANCFQTVLNQLNKSYQFKSEADKKKEIDNIFK